MVQVTEKPPKRPTLFNIIRHRGDPQVATTASGHTVIKKDRVIIPSPLDGKMISLRCADYHMEHFVYIDPLFATKLPEDAPGYWFAMCTCGSPAVIISPAEAALHDGDKYDGSQDNELVCQFYMNTLMAFGLGYHANQEGNRWD
jgi:hypothetical protein